MLKSLAKRNGSYAAPLSRAIEIWMCFVILAATLTAFGVVATGCSRDNTSDKLGFDLEILNEDGLYGPENGLRSVDYEFCIPASEPEREEVSRIDPSLQCTRGSGRIGCHAGQLLCLGNTNQDDHKRILIALAGLDYVKRIEQTYFE